MTPTSPDVLQDKAEDSEAPSDRMDGKSIELLSTVRKQSVKVLEVERNLIPQDFLHHGPGSPLDLIHWLKERIKVLTLPYYSPPLPTHTHTHTHTHTPLKQLVHLNKTDSQRGTSLPFRQPTDRLLSLVCRSSAFKKPFSFHYSRIIIITINHFWPH